MNKWLVPKFLKRLDTFLLENQPTIWRTRIHFVLFYAIAVIPFFFMLGLLYPISYSNPVVHPIEPIKIASGIYYVAPLIFCIIGILYWMYLEYQFPLQKSGLVRTLLDIFFYSIGLYFILAFTSTAFYMGLITKSAFMWITENDMEYLRENDNYIYGFVLLEEDSVYQEKGDTFFQRREAIFKNILQHEKHELQYRYNECYSNYWLKFENRNPAYADDLLKSSFELFTISVNNLSSTNNLKKLNSDITFLSYRSYRSYGFYQLYQSNKSYTAYKSDLLYLLGFANRSWLTSKHLDRSLLTFLLYMSDYSSYYSKKNISKLENYKFQKDFKTIEFEELIFRIDESIQDQYRLYTRGTGNSKKLIIPTYSYSMENVVRSVENARQYLTSNQFLCFLLSLLHLLPLICWVFAAAPFFSFRMVLWSLIVGVIIMLLSSWGFEKLILNNSFIFNDIESFLDRITYLAMPTLGLSLLMVAALFPKFNN